MRKSLSAREGKTKHSRAKRTAGEGGGQLSEDMVYLKTAKKLSVAGTQGVTQVRLDT